MSPVQINYDTLLLSSLILRVAVRQFISLVTSVVVKTGKVNSLGYDNMFNNSEKTF